MEVRYLRLWAVAAARGSWGQPDPGGAGEGGSSPDKAGVDREEYVRSRRCRGTYHLFVPRLRFHRMWKPIALVLHNTLRISTS